MITSFSLANHVDELRNRIKTNEDRIKMSAAELQASYATDIQRQQLALGATNLLIEMTETAEAITFEVVEEVKLQT